MTFGPSTRQQRSNTAAESNTSGNIGPVDAPAVTEEVDANHDK